MPLSAPPASPSLGIRQRRLPAEAWFLLAILLAGAALRLAYARERILQPDFGHPATDAHFHDYWARALVSGDWTPPPNCPDPLLRSTPYFRPPGYPFFLAGLHALFGPSPLVPLAAQAALGLLSAALAWAVGRRRLGIRAALLWAALMAFHWSFIFFEGELLEPALLSTLTLAFLGLLGRCCDRPGAPAGAAAGLVAGLLALVRPNMLLVAAALAAALAAFALRDRPARRPLARTAAAFALGLLAVVALPAARNLRVSGEPVLITANAGLNLYIGNHPHATGVFNEPPDIAPFGSVYHVPALVARLESAQNRRLSHADVSAYFSRRAWTWIARHPAPALRLLGRKFLLFWGPAAVANNKALHFEKQMSPVLSRLPALHGLCLGLAFAGFLLAARGEPPGPPRPPPDPPRRRFLALGVLFVLASFLSYWPFFAAERYRLAWTPLLLMGAATGADRLFALAARRRLRPLLPTLPLLAAGLLLGSVNWAAYRPADADGHYFRGIAHLEAGRLDAAEAALRRANALRPGHPRTLANLGSTLLRLDRLPEAEPLLRTALRLDPDHPVALVRLAQLLLRTGRPRDAAALFSRARALLPRQPDIPFQLGLACIAAGHPADALSPLSDPILPPSADLHAARALALQPLGRTADARAEFGAALRLDPAHRDALNGLAWSLATDPDTTPADRARALDLALRACPPDLPPHPAYLDTLAAAFEAHDRPGDALATLRNALALAESSGLPPLAADIRAHLARLESPPPPDP